jgi:hypothetical protein
MAKKKDKPQVINNIEELKLEIDYDKLAEAIVKANRLDNAASKDGKKIGFWKAVWLIVCGKDSKEGVMAANLLAVMLMVGFMVLFCLGLVVLLVALLAIVQQIINMNWDSTYILSNIIVLIFEALICVFLFLITIMFKGAANDLEKEKDRNYIVSLFSGVVSFAALIVALVALVKG